METVFAQSISGTEAFSALLSTKSPAEIFSIVSREGYPPLWNLLERLVFNTLGDEEIYIRGLSLFFYLGTALFTYKIASFLWSRKTGLLAGIFNLLNPLLFYYAFEGDLFSTLTLGATASMYFFLRIFRNEERIRKRDKVGYVIFTLWALYSHHLALFILVMQLVWWLYEFAIGKRARAKKTFKLFLVVIAGFVPWGFVLYTQVKTTLVALSPPGTADLQNLITVFLAEGLKNEDLRVPIVGISLYSASWYALLAVIVLRKWWKSIKSTIFFLLWFLGPILSAWFVSQKFALSTFNNFLLFTIPAAMLILVSARSKLSIVPLAVLVIFFGIIDYNYFTNPQKLPFREMAAVVKEEKTENDLLINWYSNGTHHIWETKYYGIPAPIYAPGEGDLPFFVGTALMQENDIIREIPEGVERVGVVTSGPIDDVSLPDYEQEEIKEFDGLKFVWYVPEIEIVEE